MPDGGIGYAPLFNQFDAIGIDFQPRCGSADEDRTKRHKERISEPLFLFFHAREERVMTGEQGNCARPVDTAKTSISLDMTSKRSSQVHNNDMLGVPNAIWPEVPWTTSMQRVARDMMLFYEEILPVRASTREYNPGERIGGQYFAVCCPQDRNLRLWFHDKICSLKLQRRSGITIGCPAFRTVNA
jgi:hypothetical protein